MSKTNMWRCQMLFEVVSVENSAKEKLSDCQMKTVILTLDAGVDDLSVREREGVIGLRRHRLQRIAAEAFQQGGLLTVEDIANRLLNCGERTLSLFAWLLPSAEKKAERSGAFFSADGSKNRFHFNTILL